MLKHNLILVYRNFIRFKSVFLINLIGLSTGLACVLLIYLWVKDELREYPDLVSRQKLYHHYKDILINQDVPWIDISGNYEERLKKAVGAVDELF